MKDNFGNIFGFTFLEFSKNYEVKPLRNSDRRCTRVTPTNIWNIYAQKCYIFFAYLFIYFLSNNFHPIVRNFGTTL